MKRLMTAFLFCSVGLFAREGRERTHSEQLCFLLSDGTDVDLHPKMLISTAKWIDLQAKIVAENGAKLRSSWYEQAKVTRADCIDGYAKLLKNRVMAEEIVNYGTLANVLETLLVQSGDVNNAILRKYLTFINTYHAQLG